MAGLSFEDAYEIANLVRDRLRDRPPQSATSAYAEHVATDDAADTQQLASPAQNDDDAVDVIERMLAAIVEDDEDDQDNEAYTDDEEEDDDEDEDQDDVITLSTDDLAETVVQVLLEEGYGDFVESYRSGPQLRVRTLVRCREDRV